MRQYNLPSNTQPRRSSAIIHEQQLEQSRPVIVMVAGVLLVIFSAILSGVTFHGGNWRAAFAQPSAARWALAIGLQVYCTSMEWYNRKRKRSGWYVTALGIDMLSSVGGLLAPVHLLLFVLAGSSQVYTALAVASLSVAQFSFSRLFLLEWIIALVFAFGVAYVPENKLIAG